MEELERKIRRQIEDRLRKDLSFFAAVKGLATASQSANYTLTQNQEVSLQKTCKEKWGIEGRILVAGFMGHLGEDGDGWQFGVLVGITLDPYKDGKVWEFPFILHSYKGGDWKVVPGGFNPAE